jgi:prolyl oligopeptidase
LFGAAVLEVGPLDQFRQDLTVFGGTHFERDFGSPDIPLEREFLLRTSPFQNLRPRPDAVIPLIITCTTDPNVYPAQSRRFAAKMEALGMPFYFVETPDGGHGMAATPTDRARLDALIYTYLANQLVDRCD